MDEARAKKVTGRENTRRIVRMRMGIRGW